MIHSPKSVVVSIHDVSTVTLDVSRRMLTELEQLGVSRTSLLVIPDHHHKGHILKSPEFCAWLQASVQAGHEAVVHGYFHLRQRKSKETPAQKWITRVYTQDEGEFFDISAEEALTLASRAREEFLSIGINPSGFIAPAWLLSPEAESSLKSLEFEYTTRIHGITHLPTGRFFDSRSLVYSVRNQWRRSASLAWNFMLNRSLANIPLLRIGLHPPDYAHQPIWNQVRKIIEAALEDRLPVTYENWVRTNVQG